MSVPRLSATAACVALALCAVAPHAAGAWSRVTVPGPLGMRGGALKAVSCSSRSRCTAVGYYQPRHGRRMPLIERWSGGSWSVQRAAQRFRDGTLTAVSCAAVRACVAVGGLHDEHGALLPLVELWRGRRWSLGSVRSAVGFSLSGVACPSAGSCAAVGYRQRENGWNPLAERWDGAQWRRAPGLRLPYNRDKGLYGGAPFAAACHTRSSCVAVGGQFDGSCGIYDVLVERWNGARWSYRPNPAGCDGPSDVSALSAVSCPSACTAVGLLGSEALYPVLIERWDGRRWTLQDTAVPCDEECDWALYGVSCRASSACVAVGRLRRWQFDQVTGAVTHATVPYVERRDGGAWVTDLASPALRGALSGVSCTSSGACTAVGYAVNAAGRAVPLVEHDP